MDKRHFKRGDNRPIQGVFTKYEYTVFYMNIGNGIILYDYFRKRPPELEIVFESKKARYEKAAEEIKKTKGEKAVAVYDDAAIGLLALTTFVTMGFALGGLGGGAGKIAYTAITD